MTTWRVARRKPSQGLCTTAPEMWPYVRLPEQIVPLNSQSMAYDLFLSLSCSCFLSLRFLSLINVVLFVRSNGVRGCYVSVPHMRHADGHTTYNTVDTALHTLSSGPQFACQKIVSGSFCNQA
jgi:hypothetical protein